MPNMIQRLILKSMVPGKAMTRYQIEQEASKHTGCRVRLDGFQLQMETMPDHVVRDTGSWTRWKMRHHEFKNRSRQ
jgi:hypothetical protein